MYHGLCFDEGKVWYVEEGVSICLGHSIAAWSDWGFGYVLRKGYIGDL